MANRLLTFRLETTADLFGISLPFQQIFKAIHQYRSHLGRFGLVHMTLLNHVASLFMPVSHVDHMTTVTPQFTTGAQLAAPLC